MDTEADIEIGALSTRELGGMLVRDRSAIDSAEARWLSLLADFDRRCGWVIDGHSNCVSWLVDRCGMARSTAFERLRVAHELARRPVLADAFGAGRVSYAKIRVLTRILDMGDHSDEHFLNLAAAGTVKDMQRIYRHYKLLKDQETPPPKTHRWDRCGVQTINRSNGIAVMELRVPDEDEQRLLRILDLAVETMGKPPVDKSPVETPAPAQPTWTQRRVHALLDLLEAGLAHLQAGGEVDVDRALVNVISEYDVLVEKAGGGAEIDGGIPISGETARRLACDAGLVRIITRGDSEVLDIGRKTRHWNTAQPRRR